jgi:hypothetical protein
MKGRAFVAGIMIFGMMGAKGATTNLPGQYFRLLEAGSEMVRQRLEAEPNADLSILESRSAWRHFPYAILAPAVL